MNVSRERRGSALLIVLGFVAFLIVSAVTFSIYMRYSRLPSSYLRRTATSRQLVKAALARARLPRVSTTGMAGCLPA